MPRRHAPHPALLRGFVLTLALLLHPALPGLGAQQNPACSTPEARQFDFWIGEWEVKTPDGKLAGENSIRPILDGCVLHESYRTPTGYRGESFNTFDASRKVWHQTWVDGGGTLLLLEGTFSDGVMTLRGETRGPEGPVLQRIRWSRVEGDPDRVRQLWESSGDGGKSWNVVFDGTYVRKLPSPSPPPAS